MWELEFMNAASRICTTMMPYVHDEDVHIDTLESEIGMPVAVDIICTMSDSSSGNIDKDKREKTG